MASLTFGDKSCFQNILELKKQKSNIYFGPMAKNNV